MNRRRPPKARVRQVVKIPTPEPAVVPCAVIDSADGEMVALCMHFFRRYLGPEAYYNSPWANMHDKYFAIWGILTKKHGVRATNLKRAVQLKPLDPAVYESYVEMEVAPVLSHKPDYELPVPVK